MNGVGLACILFFPPQNLISSVYTGGGKTSREKKPTSQRPSEHESMQEVSSKLDNERVIKKQGEWFQEKGGGMGGNFEEKIMKTSQFLSQNESMYEVLSKSDNGKVFKNREKILQEVSSKSSNPNQTEQVLDLHQFT